MLKKLNVEKNKNHQTYSVILFFSTVNWFNTPSISHHKFLNYVIFWISNRSFTNFIIDTKCIVLGIWITVSRSFKRFEEWKNPSSKIWKICSCHPWYRHLMCFDHHILCHLKFLSFGLIRWKIWKNLKTKCRFVSKGKSRF